MESNIQSSFIPRDAGEPAQLRRARRGGLSDLLLVLGIVAFAASAALAAAVFLYLQYLQSTSSSDLAQIERAKAQFEPALVQQLTRLDDRMHAAGTLLDAHVAPSALFDVLNQVTLKTVSFSALDFHAAGNHRIEVKMQGVAQSVNSVALQADLFSQSGVFTSPIFSGIDRQKDGVHFAVTALINPSSLNFELLTGGAAAPRQGSVLPQAPAPAQSAPAPAAGQGSPPATSTSQ